MSLSETCLFQLNERKLQRISQSLMRKQGKHRGSSVRNCVGASFKILKLDVTLCMCILHLQIVASERPASSLVTNHMHSSYDEWATCLASNHSNSPLYYAHQWVSNASLAELACKIHATLLTRVYHVIALA